MTNHINIHGVDVSKIRADDDVTVRHKVTSVGTAAGVGTVNVWIKREDWHFQINNDDITSHTPARFPLKIGDQVRSRTGAHWRIAGLNDDCVWVRGDADIGRAYYRSEVEKWEHIPS